MMSDKLLVMILLITSLILVVDLSLIINTNISKNNKIIIVILIILSLLYIEYMYLYKQMIFINYILLFVILIASMIFLIRLVLIRQKILSNKTIKEAFDVLQEGVCYFDDDGRVILINQIFNDISNSLFKMPVRNANDFIKMIDYQKPMTIRINDKIWDLHLNLLKINNDNVNEMIAYDVTSHYELNEELSKQHDELNHINEVLNNYHLTLDNIVFKSELLKAKISIHDDVGKALLVFKQYLKDHRNKDELLKIWSNTMNLLNNQQDDKEDVYKLLMDAAKAINISIEIDGKLPEYLKYQSIIISAIHECLTNTKRHAKGDKLMVKIDETDRKIDVKITNNGMIPSEEIVESGGLANLRKIVESHNARMVIDHQPRFILNIIIDKGVFNG